jgi:hypothetical protein
MVRTLAGFTLAACTLNAQNALAQNTFPHYEIGGHFVHQIDRSWDGIGAASGPITRARVVTRDVHATPDFVIEGSPFTTTPIDLPWGSEAPNRFGVPGDTLVRVLVKVGETWITFDPFRTLHDRSPERLQRAQRAWLSEHGYVDHARIVRRVDRRRDADLQASAMKQRTLPEPRAIIRIREENKPVEMELEVRAGEPAGSDFLIVDENWIRNHGTSVKRIASTSNR